MSYKFCVEADIYLKSQLNSVFVQTLINQAKQSSEILNVNTSTPLGRNLFEIIFSIKNMNTEENTLKCDSCQKEFTGAFNLS